MKKGRTTTVLRAVAVLTAGALLAGVALMGPATGAADFTKGKAKKVFFTKKGADARFVNIDDVGAGPVAFGHVNADGTLDAANSMNIVGTSLGGANDGYYCIDVAVPFRNVQVTIDDADSDLVAFAMTTDPFGACGPTDPSEPTADVVVGMRSEGNEAFWILFN